MESYRKFENSGVDSISDFRRIEDKIRREIGRLFSANLRERIGITLEESEKEKFERMRTASLKGLLFEVRETRAKVSGLIHFDRSLVDGVVNRSLGGVADNAAASEAASATVDKPITKIEVKIIENFASLVSGILNDSFDEVLDAGDRKERDSASFELLDAYLDLRLFAGISADRAVQVLRYSLSWNGALAGELEIILPYTLLYYFLIDVA